MKETRRKLGLVSAILGDQSTEDMYRIASDCGIKAIQLMCWDPNMGSNRRYAGACHFDVTGDLTEMRADDAHALAAKYGLKICGTGYYANPMATDPEEARITREHTLKVIKASQLLNVPYSGFLGRNQLAIPERNWSLVQGAWQPILQVAEDLGVDICLENCPMDFTLDEWPHGKNIFTGPDTWDRGFELLPSDRLFIEFDPAHWVWQEISLDSLRPYMKKVRRVHAKDARRNRRALARHGNRSAPLMTHTPCLPGEGGVDWDHLRDVLDEGDYNDVLVIEVEDKAYEACLADKIIAIRRSVEYLQTVGL